MEIQVIATTPDGRTRRVRVRRAIVPVVGTTLDFFWVDYCHHQGWMDQHGVAPDGAPMWVTQPDHGRYRATLDDGRVLDGVRESGWDTLGFGDGAEVRVRLEKAEAATDGDV